MSYASDLGLRVGSKIKVLESDYFFKQGDVITLLEDDGTKLPWFSNANHKRQPFNLRDYKWEHYKEEEKDMTLGYKVGDKVEIVSASPFDECVVKVGDIATVMAVNGRELEFSCPTWGKAQWLCAQRSIETAIKPHVAAKPKTPFEAAGYTAETKFKCLVRYGDFSKGDIVTLHDDDGTLSPEFINAEGDTHYMILPTDDEAELEVYVEEATKLKSPLTFPCCVPMSEIKDQDTFDKVFALFLTNGAEKYETDYEDNKNYGYKFFGADYNKDTMFYSCVESYSFNDEEDEVTVYSVAELLGLVPEKEEAATSSVIALLPVGAEVQIAKDSEWYYGDEFSSNPKDIKGVITSNTHSSDSEGFVYYVKWSNGSANSYKLKDLVLWNEGWIEWNGGEDSPEDLPARTQFKFRNGDVEVKEAPYYYRWEHYNERDIVAYRPHTPAIPSVASQEAITERLEDKPSVGIDLGKEASSEPVEPYEYKVGDLVEITACKYGHRFDIGEVVRLTSKGYDGGWEAEHLDKRDYWCIYDSEYKLSSTGATQSEVKETPLVSIVKDVTYTVIIKGTPITLTQDEINELTEELLGFSDDF